MTNTLQERNFFENDWLIGIYIFLILFFAIFKNYNPQKFNNFINIFVSDKYFKMIANNKDSKSLFRLLVFVFMILGFSLISFYGWCIKYQLHFNDYILFIKITTFWTTLLLGKYYIEKIISITLDLESLLDSVYLNKTSYVGLTVLLLLPLLILFQLNNWQSSVFVGITVIFIVLAYLFSFIKFITDHANKIFPNFYYFILYICGLEIAPYFLVINSLNLK